MHWQSTPYTLPLLMAAALSACLAIYAGRHRSAPGARPFSVLVAAIAVWSLGYSLELAGTELPLKVLWAKIEYLGIVTAPSAWLAFAIQYTNREEWLSRRKLALLAVEPVITLLLFWTNEYHGLIWSAVRLNSSGSFSVLESFYGAAFWGHAAYSYLVLLAGTLLIARAFVRSPHMVRGQMGALLLGALAPWVGNVAYLAGLSPFPHLDLTPLAFTLCGALLAWGLFHYRLLDIVPIARDIVIESMSDGVVVLDVQGRIVDLNPAAQAIIGRPAAQAIGRPAAEVFADWPDLVERYRGVTQARDEIKVEEEAGQRYYDLSISPLYERRMGRPQARTQMNKGAGIGGLGVSSEKSPNPPIPAKRSASALADGNPRPTERVGQLLVLRDITRLKELDRMKSQFVSTVSHELRTPVAAIKLHTENLIEFFDLMSPDQRRSFLTDIQTQADTLAQLIEDILNLSRLEVSSLEPQWQSIEFVPLLQEILNQMTPLAQHAGVSLLAPAARPGLPSDTPFPDPGDRNGREATRAREASTPAPPIWLKADRGQIKNVLRNLLSNAIKFTPAGGQVACRVGAENGHLILSIVDTGMGIPAQELPHIYDRFYRGRQVAAQHIPGTGLGLAIVKQVVEAHGGTVEVESAVGAGTTFTVRLPRAEQNRTRTRRAISL